MGILSDIILAILHLSCVAIDMALLLLLFRILGQWRPIRWVQRVNDVTQPLVDPLTSTLRRHWETLVCLRLTPRGTLALSVLTLCLARCLLCAIAGVLP
jgi:uncharacterized protein YggT (Ycf19 family)